MRRTTGHAEGGFFLPLVVGALILFGTYAAYFMFSSQNELALTAKQIKQDRARLIAESALDLGRAAIFQNAFDRRWYKQQPAGGKRFGYRGTMAGSLGGGEFLVVGEDIANPAKGEFKDFVAGATYNRIDLFAEGRFEGAKVIVYKALYWHPEQKVWEWDVVETQSVENGKVTTKEQWANFRQR